LDQLIVRGEREIGTWRAVQMAVVAEKKRRKSYQADGHRSIVDWFAARADVSHETARSVCWIATRLAEALEVAELLATGEITFDWAEQVARLPVAHRSGHEGCDISGLGRLVAHHKRLTKKRERKLSNSGFLNMACSDEIMTSVWGELPGLDARIVAKAVDQRADEIIPGDARLGVAQRRALALVAICQDSLYATGDEHPPTSPPVEVAVIVDARTATATGGETGVSVLAGPRLGPRILEEIFCSGTIEVFGIAETGEPLNLGRKTRTVSRSFDVTSWPETEAAPWRVAPPTIGSKSTTARPGPGEGEPTPTS